MKNRPGSVPPKDVHLKDILPKAAPSAPPKVASPPTVPPKAAPHETPAWVPRRSAGGARTESTERITLRAPGFEAMGWTLNVSRGGFRAILECQLDKQLEYEVFLGEVSHPRRASLVWCQEQADGLIAGFRYTDVEASSPKHAAPDESSEAIEQPADSDE